VVSHLQVQGVWDPLHLQVKNALKPLPLQVSGEVESQEHVVPNPLHLQVKTLFFIKLKHLFLPFGLQILVLCKSADQRTRRA
jgi:hypothetical protein